MKFWQRMGWMGSAVGLSLLSACAYTGGPAAEPAAAPAPSTVAPVAASPAPVASPAQAPAAPVVAAGEAALNDGLKAYQAGQYKQAEAQLAAALKAGLATPADQVAAHKHLAFIYCTSKRDTMCAASFKAAKAADPSFALSKAEAGHPMWARTYKRALGLK
jgi:hypothetical protein